MNKMQWAVVCLSSLGVVAACGGQADTSNAASEAVSSVGASCVPSDSERTDFGAFSASEVNIDDRNDACGAGVCLVHNFQGRVSCPYGNQDGGGDCLTPSGETVTASVVPQLVDRPPSDTVHCSCRCDGPGDGPFCACPSGFACQPLVDDLGLPGAEEFAGSYCVKAGTEVEEQSVLENAPTCDRGTGNCDDLVSTR